MPVYFWIILATIASLATGFALGFWISNKERLKGIAAFRENLDKVVQKLDSIEKLIPASRSSVQSKTNAYQAKAVSIQLKNDILAVADRLEKLINNLKTKPRRASKVAKENETKIIIGNKKTFKPNESENISNTSEQLPFLSEDETQPHSFNDFQEPGMQITQLYNRGVDDRSERDLFREKYAIIRLGNDKAVELRLGEVLEPEFRELDNGNFLAISGDDGSFYVLPRFDTTLNLSAFNEGGFSFVFDCPDYNHDMAYTIVRVKRPAIFRRDADGWMRIEKGELLLQQ